MIINLNGVTIALKYIFKYPEANCVVSAPIFYKLASAESQRMGLSTWPVILKTHNLLFVIAFIVGSRNY